MNTGHRIKVSFAKGVSMFKVCIARCRDGCDARTTHRMSQVNTSWSWAQEEKSDSPGTVVLDPARMDPA